MRIGRNRYLHDLTPTQVFAGVAVFLSLKVSDFQVGHVLAVVLNHIKYLRFCLCLHILPIKHYINFTAFQFLICTI
jgi:hypothetical protein